MPSAASSEQGDAFDRIPKVELHCHVEGTVRAETVVELARKAGRPLPVDDPADLYRYDSLDTFLAVFWLVQETLVDREDWARVAYESLVDGAAHGAGLPGDGGPAQRGGGHRLGGGHGEPGRHARTLVNRARLAQRAREAGDDLPQVAGHLGDQLGLLVDQCDLVGQEKSIRGSYMGSCVPVRDIPRFIRLYREGRLPVDRLIDGHIGYDRLNAGFDKLQDVRAIRQILTPNGD